MRQAIDAVLLSFIGRVNQAVFSVSRGRVVLYRFHGRTSVFLTLTGPDAPLGEKVPVGHLPDGDDCIVLAAEHETGVLTALGNATSATAEFGYEDVPVDLVMLTDDGERAALLERLLKRASIHERHEVMRRREVPVARVTPHYRPESDHAVAVIRVP